MKIIFSRKGFDTASGGVPSPIFPNGRMISLPIPDDQSPLRYRDIRWGKYDLGGLVTELTGGGLQASDRAHLDPDLRHDSLPRQSGWRPIFGQTGAAQGHLRRNGVGPGDIFLFFGLFRAAIQRLSHWAWDTHAPPVHALWGWLQIDEVLNVADCDRSIYGWTAYHPHFQRTFEANNTVYIARRFLSLPKDGSTRLPGAGVFGRFAKKLRLTAADSTKPSLWELPAWFYPEEGKHSLTYHSDLARWQRTKSNTRLRSAGRGQEFILDAEEYPEATDWLKSLLVSE
jgi:hypothetical protein